MPRLPSNIDRFRDKIAASYAAGESIPSILRSIKEEGCDCTQRTLERRIQVWGLQRHALSVHTDAVVSRIQFLFFVQGWTDDFIKDDLERSGISTTVRTIQNIRLKHGMRRRFRTDEDRNQALRQASDWLQQHVQRGPAVQGFGGSYIYEFVRTQAGILVGKHQIYQYHRSTWSEEVRQQHGQTKTYINGKFVIPGRNFLWCFDGHTELRRMGIEIFACIDAYSRMIIWVYVGPSSCTPVSTLKQFLRTISVAGVRPLFTQAGMGIQSALFAGAQGLLAESGRTAIPYDGPDGEERIHRQGNRLTSCHIWSDKEEHRIGSWWRTTRTGSPDRWLTFAEELSATGLLNTHDDRDLIAVYAIYGPMLRTEITEFVQLWNNHAPRRTAKPSEIYDSSSVNWGVPIEEGTATERLLRNLAAPLESIEADAFFPQETEDWCNAQLENMGFHNIRRAQVDYKHPHLRIYLELRRRVREHRASGQAPHLSITSRPELGGRGGVDDDQYVTLLGQNIFETRHDLHGDPVPADMLDGINECLKDDEEQPREKDERAAQP